MSFETLSRVLGRDAQYANALHQKASQEALTAAVRQALPPTLRTAVISVMPGPRALSVVASTHANATKLYQFQQQILAALSAKDLNINEIRVIVQARGAPSNPSRPRAILPAEASAPLQSAIARAKSPRLQAALAKLRTHAGEK
jgi:hypothetical protein